MPALHLVGPGEPVPTGGWLAFTDLPVPHTAVARRLDRAGPADVVLLVPGRQRARPLGGESDDPRALLPDAAVPVFAAEVLGGRAPDPDLDRDLAATLLLARVLAGPADLRVTVVGVPGLTLPAPGREHRSRFGALPARYAALLDRVAAERGDVPRRLQSLVVGQVLALLREDAGLSTVAASLTDAEVGSFHTALATIRAHLDREVVTADPGGTDELRAVLLLGQDQHSRPVRRTDSGRGLDRVSYFYRGTVPDEHLDVEPRHHKLRVVDAVTRPVLGERIVWLPQGAALTLPTGAEVDVRSTHRTSRAARYERIVRENPDLPRRALRDARIALRARSGGARTRYADAWLLMDRDNAAGDNAEHLYRHLRAEAPDVNAWFVLARDSRDWERLAAEGFRLLEFGSDEHLAALLHCVHLVSSQIDGYVINPLRRHLLPAGRWRFTFLQHGVLRHDLSRWLNPKKLDLFVTSTPDERDAVAGDGTPYVFTDLETRMPGLARHDRLLRLADETRERTLLLVMPTWRDGLLGEQSGGNDRDLIADFWQTPYARTWRELLGSAAVRELCAAQGWELVFVPHPNMQDYLAGADLPPHVQSLRYKDIDVQQVLARAVAVVTDFSSLANEAAYIRRAVVYHQVDRDEFFRGGHFHRQGRWSYADDGFGPVTTDVAGTVAALARIAAHGGPESPYAERIERGFPLRDGRCCERTVAEIRALGRQA